MRINVLTHAVNNLLIDFILYYISCDNNACVHASQSSLHVKKQLGYTKWETEANQMNGWYLPEMNGGESFTKLRRLFYDKEMKNDANHDENRNVRSTDALESTLQHRREKRDINDIYLSMKRGVRNIKSFFRKKVGKYLNRVKNTRNNDQEVYEDDMKEYNDNTKDKLTKNKVANLIQDVDELPSNIRNDTNVQIPTKNFLETKGPTIPSIKITTREIMLSNLASKTVRPDSIGDNFKKITAKDIVRTTLPEIVTRHSSAQNNFRAHERNAKTPLFYSETNKVNNNLVQNKKHGSTNTLLKSFEDIKPIIHRYSPPYIYNNKNNLLTSRPEQQNDFYGNSYSQMSFFKANSGIQITRPAFVVKKRPNRNFNYYYTNNPYMNTLRSSNDYFGKVNFYVTVRADSNPDKRTQRFTTMDVKTNLMLINFCTFMKPMEYLLHLLIKFT